MTHFSVIGKIAAHACARVAQACTAISSSVITSTLFLGIEDFFFLGSFFILVYIFIASFDCLLNGPPQGSSQSSTPK
jgi:hypothetical protein